MHLKADTRHRVTVTLNGRERAGYAEPRTLLSDFLRHELGATGTRLIITLLRELARRQLRWGVTSACIGGGQGVAMIIERV